MNTFSMFKDYLRAYTKSLNTNLQLIDDKMDAVSYENYKAYDNSFIDTIVKRVIPNKYYKRQLEQAEIDLMILAGDYMAVEREIFYVKKIISSFENDKVINVIGYSVYLYDLAIKAYHDGFITIEDISRIMGATFAYNCNHPKKMESAGFNYLDYQEIGAFYDETGDFEYQDMYEGLGKLYYEHLGRDKDISDAIGTLYDEFVAGYVEPPVEFKVEFVEEKIPYGKLRELQKYYKNGELLEIPSDFEHFDALLNECFIGEDERIYIRRLMKQALNERKKEKIVLNRIRGNY